MASPARLAGRYRIVTSIHPKVVACLLTGNKTARVIWRHVDHACR
jgi:hypothetical protein